MTKLNQIVAVEKGIKSRVYSEITELHKQCQKADLFSGFQKRYKKKDEEGEEYPPEIRRVQMTAPSVLSQIEHRQIELFDITATKDYANCSAKADVVVDGVVIVKDAPVTYLLFLEKQITDLRTFIDKLPTLEDTEEWQHDVNTELYRTEPITTHRTKKIQKPIVLVEPTKEHPAQAQLVTEDVVAGFWELVKMSGALPVPRKQELLDRVEALGNAIKYAREQANGADALEVKVGARIFSYLFA